MYCDQLLGKCFPIPGFICNSNGQLVPETCSSSSPHSIFRFLPSHLSAEILIDGDITIFGDFGLEGGSIEITPGATLQIVGSVDVAGGQLILKSGSGIDVSGDISLSPTSSLNLSDNVTVTVGGCLLLSGTLRLDTADLTTTDLQVSRSFLHP